MSPNPSDTNQSDGSTGVPLDPETPCVECGEPVGIDSARSTLGPLCTVCIDAFLAAGQGGIFEHVEDGGHEKTDQ